MLSMTILINIYIMRIKCLIKYFSDIHVDEYLQYFS